MTIVDDLERIYNERGAVHYEIHGRDGVTQLQHALQCAALAAAAGSSDELVAASLLHDLGHLLPDPDEARKSTDKDDVHQYIALPFLRPHFPAAVLEPIKLHVDAKRYLCATEGAYWAALSAGSRRSLELQGGPFDDDAVQHFLVQPFAEEAAWLRRWDDRAKDMTRVVAPFSSYRDLLTRVSLGRAARV